MQLYNVPSMYHPHDSFLRKHTIQHSKSKEKKNCTSMFCFSYFLEIHRVRLVLVLSRRLKKQKRILFGRITSQKRKYGMGQTSDNYNLAWILFLIRLIVFGLDWHRRMVKMKFSTGKNNNNNIRKEKKKTDIGTNCALPNLNECVRNAHAINK